MPRRPLDRVPILEQCPRCGRRSRPEGPLCVRCWNDTAEWRNLPFPTLPMNREEQRQAQMAFDFGSSVVVRTICPHGFDTWTDCPACVAVADFDDGGPVG